MAYINKKDTQGTKPLLAEGELGYDKYTAGGDVGRVYVGTGTSNIAQAKKSEVMAVDSKVDTHITRVDNPHNVTKTQVGLANVDNTSDANKPISTATQNALNTKVDKVTGKQLSTEDYTTAEKTKLAGIASGAQVNTVTSVAEKTGSVTLTKSDVGLSNVDNTSDANKNVLSATKLTTARTINGVSFNGTADITIADSTKAPLTGAGASGTWGISITGNATTASTSITSNALNGISYKTLDAVAKAECIITGGGTITVSSTWYVLWSERFILINNGNGAHLSTSGYFDITCPVSGTITGVGGAANKTATAAGIPLAAWESLYYILPIGSNYASVDANFRVVSYNAAIEIPATWIKICSFNGDGNYIEFANGVSLKNNQSLNTTFYDSYEVYLAERLRTARTINGVSFDGSANITIGVSGDNITWATTATAGKFDTSTTTPTGSNRLNYGGYFYPTYINLTGSADTTTAPSHVFVETGSDGFVRPQTLAQFKTNLFSGTTAIGDATATTKATEDNSTAVATTAFVQATKIGVGQTWQDVTSSRALSTTYTNSTGKPILVIISSRASTANKTYTLVIDGVTVLSNTDAYWALSTLTFIVPSGSTYQLSSTGTISKWSELR